MLEAAGCGGLCRLGLDCAASHFYDSHNAFYRFWGREAGWDELIQYFEVLSTSYGLLLLEDPLEEDDFDGYAEITRRVPSRIVGHDLFAMNLERLTRGVAVGAANGLILKPNMVGTITEALVAARYAADNGYLVVGSCRAGGTVATGAPLIKLGAPRTGERLNLQNCFLRVEEELGAATVSAGPRVRCAAAAPTPPGAARVPEGA